VEERRTEERQWGAASLHSDADRVERVADEMERALGGLAGIGAAVSVFGSARTSPQDPSYERARALGAELARAGLAVITGGGGGSMEAVNRGAQEAGGHSIGLRLGPVESDRNAYLDLDLRFNFFFVRKIMFLRFACAFVVLPGGFGTLDELFEALALIQTRRVSGFPVILHEREHWRGLAGWLREGPLARGMIDAGDLDLLRMSDDPAEVAAIAAAAAAVRRGPPAAQ